MTREILHLHDEKVSRDTANGIDFTNLIYALWQGKWLIVTTTALTILAGGYYAFVVVTPVYRSSSVVILEPKSDQIVTFQSVTGGLTGDTPEVNSEVEILRARSLMHDVVEKLDLFNDTEFNRSLTPPTPKVVLKSKIKHRLGWSTPPENLTPVDFDRRTRDSVVTALLRKVRIENLRKSTVFRINVQTKTAAKSALIADTIAHLYVEQQITRKIESAAQATVWLENRVGELQLELEQAEAKASDFSASTALVSPESLQAQKRKIKALRERITEAEQEKILTEINAKTLQSARDIGTKIEVANDAQLTRFALDDTYRVAFDSRFETILERAASDKVRAGQQLETLRFSEADLRSQIDKQGQDLIYLQQLDREAHATRVLYEHFLSRLKETASQQGIQKADSRILSPAVIPYKPSEPRKSLIVSMSAIFGLTASLCLVLIAELRRSTFRSLSSLERHVGYIGLAQFPVISIAQKPDLLDELAANPKAWFSNSIRDLRTSLMLNKKRDLKVIGITSSVQNEGGASMAVALAANFVRLDKSVLLIDTCQTQDRINDYFGDEPTRGIFTVLRDEYGIDQSLHHPETLGADVLFCDDNSTSASDLFLSQKFETFVAEMKDRYALIIVNAPAITTAPATRAVLKTADTVLLSVKWDSTQKTDVNAALRMLQHADISVSGVLLSETETQIITSKFNLGAWFRGRILRNRQRTTF